MRRKYRGWDINVIKLLIEYVLKDDSAIWLFPDLQTSADTSM